MKFLKYLFLFIFLNSFQGLGEINSNVDMIFMKNLTNDFFTSLYGFIIKINQITLIPHMLLGTMILPILLLSKILKKLIKIYLN